MTDTLDPALPRHVLDLADSVLRLADAHDFMLATAESCTGGLLAALLTDMPGHSHVFDRGFIVYSDDAKCDLLDISRGEVERCGAVSREVALAMARGALRRSKADVALAITGFAGPSGGDDEEEGLVHFACAGKKGGNCHRVEHFGAIGRQKIRIAALEVALKMMETALAQQTAAKEHPAT